VRTKQEVLEKLKEPPSSMFGFDYEIYTTYVSFEECKAAGLTKEGATGAEWGVPHPLTRERVLSDMADYMMGYGWPKARDHRGLSAGRTIDKMRAWMWLLKDDYIAVKIDSDELSHLNYGCPILEAICKRYDFPIPQDEDIARMIRGESCQPNCQEGCGQ